MTCAIAWISANFSKPEVIRILLDYGGISARLIYGVYICTEAAGSLAAQTGTAFWRLLSLHGITLRLERPES